MLNLARAHEERGPILASRHWRSRQGGAAAEIRPVAAQVTVGVVEAAPARRRPRPRMCVVIRASSFFRHWVFRHSSFEAKALG